jgi:ADP-ribose pyrophosphatase YjhB (NUDIX family)
MAKERNKHVPASYLALIKDSKILLQRRFNTGFQDGKYSLPAGNVERGETFTQCVIREIKEEIGIDLKEEDLKVVHVMQRDSRKDYPQGVAEGINERMDIFFTAEKWQGNIENKEPEKCDNLAWFDLDSLPDNIISYVKRAVDCIKNKNFYSEYGWNYKSKKVKN